MKIALMPNLTRPDAAAVTAGICRELDRLGAQWYCSAQTSQLIDPNHRGHVADERGIFENADVIITVGGDGSVIRAVRQSSVTGGKVLGVNAGRLAYLCELDPGELNLLEKLVRGEYGIQKRMMLRATVKEDGKEIYSAEGINDIVFRRDAGANLIGLDVSANGRKIADYYADGVIFATPTGSSAYSLSAGGAIVEPTIQATLVTPICPHSLIIRPYVFSPQTVFSVRPDSGNVNTVLSVDGGAPVELSEKSVVTVTRAERCAEFVTLKSNIFIDVLNKKLGQ